MGADALFADTSACAVDAVWMTLDHPLHFAHPPRAPLHRVTASHLPARPQQRRSGMATWSRLFFWSLRAFFFGKFVTRGALAILTIYTFPFPTPAIPEDQICPRFQSLNDREFFFSHQRPADYGALPLAAELSHQLNEPEVRDWVGRLLKVRRLPSRWPCSSLWGLSRDGYP